MIGILAWPSLSTNIFREQREQTSEVLSHHMCKTCLSHLAHTFPFWPKILATLGRTVSDLTNRLYYFESIIRPKFIWVHLDKLGFTKGAILWELDLVNEPDRLDDMSAQFKEKKQFECAKPIVTL